MSLSSSWKQTIAQVTTDGEDARLFHIDCPSTQKEEKGAILLIHGFPETSYQFRHVLEPLSEAGYRLIVPDTTGHGNSSHHPHRYTKALFADDLYHLLQNHLKITKPIYVVGHDIGGMIAHSFATRYPSFTKAVIWGECPLPGTAVYEEKKGSRLLFHFGFQSQVDLAVQLVTGKEKQYLKHFYDRLGFNAIGIPPDALDHYASIYSQPGALRAAFSVYEAFELDADENLKRVMEKSKRKVPALGLNGEFGPFAQDMESMLSEMYDDYVAELVPKSGHWIAEENPNGFIDSVLRFLAKHPQS
ncbi:alpha/beta-hydrolase [Stipitochalara longipes BDJ]|nr:alpha/beta-hydrolase [Stipitochalara longipes BDJ]